MTAELASVLITAAVAIGGSWLVARAGRMRYLEDRIDRLEAAREAAGIAKRRLGDHVDLLEHHIYARKPPPPPTRPEGI
jgi:hypothetical protein